ncbi:YdcF family protein [Clostridium estertheticum]|uniref:YdcF family protein n=1 Tax=Clostridium estertheticum TaxID=238834 RepID=A0A5N7IVF1_9CLOT|nr:YdcF family protein [Clostridium estertheticum]MPQ64694.1 YdcF family protein [Clostridium estertheticum]
MIVLGYHAKKNGTVSLILRERINKASRLYHDGIAKTIICSGAAVGNDNIEADVMAKALIELGIPDYSIIREKLSKNTYGNLINSREIMQISEFNTAIIVSSPCHLRKEYRGGI